MLNNPADILGIILGGTLGRSGRKRARRATKFLTGHKGFLRASTIIGAAGVAWGIYDTLKNQGAAVPNVPEVPGQQLPPVPAAVQSAIDPVVRVIQLAVSAAKADGTLTDQERAMIVERARQAGVESIVDAELAQPRPLAAIVGGVTDVQAQRELYVLAFTIIRADEAVSGAERIYLAQLANYLGLDPAAAQAIENETATAIDAQTAD